MTHTAVVAGVGPGLGESLVRRFVAEGCSVGMFARSGETIEELEANLAADVDDEADASGEALAVPTDVTDESQVREGFERVREAFGPVDVLVNNASAGSWKGLLDASSEEFARPFEVNGLGAFHCSREAVSDMLANDGGTVIFTGATSAIRGRGGAIGFSAAKFAARGMAESMARELGPEGIHVAHVVVDGQIANPRTLERAADRDEETFVAPDAMAESYWHLVEQDRSAWTLELDLRPHVEEF